LSFECVRGGRILVCRLLPATGDCPVVTLKGK
jgi:hypothetical protein